MWKEININKQNIIYRTDKAVLIAMPHKSHYDGYTFWYPKKLIKNNDSVITISFNEDFMFKIKKTSPKTRQVLAEDEITADEMEMELQMIGENNGQ